MTQPERCVVPGQENKVCKLLKSLYGLKQAPKQWHEKLDNVLLCDGFSPNDADKCVYSKSENGECVIICLYVDDMLIFGTCIDIVSRTKLFLGSKFEMKDMGEANVILGVRIIRKGDSILLSQEQYIEKLLRNFGYYDFKHVSTPYDANSNLMKNRGESISQPQYAQIIRSLLHLMSFSRPDIAYAVGRLSRYTQCPNQEHWDALGRLMRYLRGSKYAQIIGSLLHLTSFSIPDIAYAVGRLSRYTQCPNQKHWDALGRLMRYLRGSMDYAIEYSGFLAVLEGYNDANWISDSDETKSTSGYVFTLRGGAITWRSAKQTIIARSTMESEFVALEMVGSEAEWLENFLANIPLGMKPTPSVSIHCDCQSAIVIAKNKNYNRKNRHIQLRHNLVKQLLKSRTISIDYVNSKRNLADPLTKPLGRNMILETSRGMILKSLANKQVMVTQPL